MPEWLWKLLSIVLVLCAIGCGAAGAVVWTGPDTVGGMFGFCFFGACFVIAAIIAWDRTML